MPRAAALCLAAALLVPLLAAAPARGQENDPAALPDEIPERAAVAEVVRVVDGDTLEVEIAEDGHAEEGETKDVRLIGINTPPKKEVIDRRRDRRLCRVGPSTSCASNARAPLLAAARDSPIRS